RICATRPAVLVAMSISTASMRPLPLANPSASGSGLSPCQASAAPARISTPMAIRGSQILALLMARVMAGRPRKGVVWSSWISRFVGTGCPTLGDVAAQRWKRLGDAGPPLGDRLRCAIELQQADLAEPRHQQHVRRLAGEARAGDQILHDVDRAG